MNQFCEGQIIKVLQKVKRTGVEPKFYSVSSQWGNGARSIVYGRSSRFGGCD